MIYRDKKEVIDKAEMERVLLRISHQIIERNKGTGNLVLIGIRTRGIYIVTDTCDGSEIWLNRFVNNAGENARDNSGTGDTSWDKGGIGNYWDDYGGDDANDDGIGDNPYSISGTGGSQDNFPLIKCPLPKKGAKEFPIELIIFIVSISGGAVIGISTLLLSRRKRKRKR